jgi:hypothetical protein
MVHTQAYAEDEWKNVQQWNPPTSVTIARAPPKPMPLSFCSADQIRNIEKTLIADHRPVAVGHSRLCSADGFGCAPVSEL